MMVQLQFYTVVHCEQDFFSVQESVAVVPLQGAEMYSHGSPSIQLDARPTLSGGARLSIHAPFLGP